MADKDRLFNAWTEFAAAAIPDRANLVQVDVMRQAFYAGACAFLNITTSEMSDSEECTPEDDAIIEGIHAELVQFQDEMLERTKGQRNG